MGLGLTWMVLCSRGGELITEGDPQLIYVISGHSRLSNRECYYYLLNTISNLSRLATPRTNQMPVK